MKHLKITGLCLVAMFAMSMVAAATASATWEQCASGGATTKYETNQCAKASSTGTFSWQEVKGTEKTKGFGSLRLADTKVPIVGTVAVQCTGEAKGAVGPGQLDRTTAIVSIVCAPSTNCEKVEKTASPENLPWQTELATVEGKKRDNVKAVNGKGAGWAVTCKVLGITKTDVCTTEEGSAGVANTVTKGVSGELLVLGTFDAKSINAKCELGGALSGEVRGTISTLLETGAALRIA